MPGINDQQRRFAKSPSGVLVPESCFTLDSSNSQTTQPIPGSVMDVGASGQYSRPPERAQVPLFRSIGWVAFS